MRSMHKVAAIFGLAAHLFAPVFACDMSMADISDNSTSSSPQMVIGPEGSDPDTTGYNINHFALNVRNLTRSLEFYTQVFGMRHMFTLAMSEHYSITYMAHSSGGKNGTGYQTTQELIRNQHNSQGLLELLHLNVPGNDVPSSTETPNTFFHVGMIVPDIEATQARLERFGVPIYKKIGERFPAEGPLNKAAALDPAALDPKEYEGLLEFITQLNSRVVFAPDPDGNVLEIMGREGSAVVEI
jgi:lactoylglutathione lyase